jgi:Sulfite reductase, alpha subunit (flavoprotein)
MQKQTETDKAFGEIWLFYGCRFEDRDFLYRFVVAIIA